jgi:recombinational DNA repair protein RecR
MNANPLRGEVIIEFDGIAYVMRPTFAVLAAIEQRLSQSLIQLAQKISDETISLQEVTIIIELSMENRAPAHFLTEAIIRNGLSRALDAVANLFVIIFGGLHAITQ